MEDSDSFFLDDSALMSIDLGQLTQQAAAAREAPAAAGQAQHARIRELEQQLSYKTAEATNLRSNIDEARLMPHYPPLHCSFYLTMRGVHARAAVEPAARSAGTSCPRSDRLCQCRNCEGEAGAQTSADKTGVCVAAQSRAAAQPRLPCAHASCAYCASSPDRR